MNNCHLYENGTHFLINSKPMLEFSNFVNKIALFAKKQSDMFVF